MRILLTGASGFIGQHLKETWQTRYELFAPSRQELDLLDAAAVEDYLRRGCFDIVVHAANTNDVVHPERAQQMLELNLRMFCNLERLSDLYGKLYYFGSGAEYDSRHYTDRMAEEDFGRHIPADPYGFSKYIMAKMAERSGNIFNLRLFGVFGKNEEWRRRFISNMIYQALMGNVMRMDCDMSFDYLYVDDLPRILDWFLTHEPRWRHYNVCSGQPVELRALAGLVKEETGSCAEIIVSRPGRKLPYTGDNSRLRLEMGELTVTPMRQAVREMVAFYQEQGFQ